MASPTLFIYVLLLYSCWVVVLSSRTTAWESTLEFFATETWLYDRGHGSIQLMYKPPIYNDCHQTALQMVILHLIYIILHNKYRSGNGYRSYAPVLKQGYLGEVQRELDMSDKEEFTCNDCGETFPGSPFYKDLCLTCYRKIFEENDQY